MTGTLRTFDPEMRRRAATACRADGNAHRGVCGRGGRRAGDRRDSRSRGTTRRSTSATIPSLQRVAHGFDATSRR